MEAPPAAARVLRFGIFELDAHSGELRRHGLKVRLPDQAFQILRLLLARPGDVITREELRQRLWTSDTFVDFDLGLNGAIHKLREALGDSADNPQFIQTLPRRGYRFIAPVKAAADDRTSGSVAPSVSPSARLSPKWIAGGLALAVMTAAPVLYQRGWRDRVRTDAGAASAGSLAERHPLARRAIDPAAYDAYMKGVAAAGLQTTEGFRNAVAYFEEAVAKQPDFAMAYASLGLMQLQILYGGPLSPRETVPKAEAATRKALQLDDTLPLAHRTLAGILRNYYWRWEDADKEFQRARELEKNPAESSAELIESGQFALAIAQAERNRRLDPLSFEAAVAVGSAYRAAGQYDRAIAEYGRALEITPGRPRGHFQLGVTLVFMGRLKEAIDELETSVRLSPSGNSRHEAYLAYACAAAGRRADTRRILKKLQSRARHEYVSSFGIALIYDALGEKEPALAAFERAYQDRAVEFSLMQQYPPFKTIAFDPRFQARMREIGLPISKVPKF